MTLRCLQVSNSFSSTELLGHFSKSQLTGGTEFVSLGNGPGDWHFKQVSKDLSLLAMSLPLACGKSSTG